MLNQETKTKKCCQRHTTAYPRGGIRSCRLYNVPTSITRLVGDSSDPSACQYTVPSLRLTDTASEAITPQGPDRTRERANQLCTESSSSTHEDSKTGRMPLRLDPRRHECCEAPRHKVLPSEVT